MSMWDCPQCGGKSVLYRVTREQEENELPGSYVCTRKDCGYEEAGTLESEPPISKLIREIAARQRSEAEAGAVDA